MLSSFLRIHSIGSLTHTLSEIYFFPIKIVNKLNNKIARISNLFLFFHTLIDKFTRTCLT